MAYIDYYKILGVSKTATDSDIKKAYRKLARKYHPDLNPNDKEAETKFKEINEANEVLSNTENKKKYDAYGEHWQNAEAYEQAKQQQEHQKRSQSASGNHSEQDFSDIFGSMFGDSSSSQRSVKYRGHDFNAEMQLDIKDVFTTQKRTLTINGKNIRITIPAGVENGQIIKIKGHGGKGFNNGPNGDLYIQFSIKNTSQFRRDGHNLYISVDVDLYKSVLGGDIMVHTFDGKVKLKVKPETQNGTKVKLKGKGFPKYKKEGEFGDLFVTYNIKIPKNLTDKEKELFTELSKLR
jgi:curved DNA-binding protein|nr:J domain-containing protein [uncultured Psychroserpens sp.]